MTENIYMKNSYSRFLFLVAILVCSSAEISFGRFVQDPSTPIPAGQLLWQDSLDRAHLSDNAEAVTAIAGKVVVVGECTSKPRNADILIRTYDGATGAVLWEDQIDFAGFKDGGNCVTANEHIVVAGGFVSDDTLDSENWFLRAYDLVSGKQLWNVVAKRDGKFNEVHALAIRGESVFAVGAGGAECGRDKGCDQVIRSYNIHTGALLWQLQFDDGSDDDALGAATFGNILAVGSQAGIRPNDTSTAFTVRTYNTENGNLIWKDQIALQGASGMVNKVTLSDNRLIAGGMSNSDWLVRAYDISTGKLLWEDPYNLDEKSANIFDAVWQVTANHNHVAAAGYGSHKGLNRVSRDWVVRLYDAQSGKLLWNDRYDPAGKFDEAIGGVAISQGQVFAYSVVTDTMFLNMFVRAYDEETGKILWQDKFEKGHLSSATYGLRTSLALDNNRITVVGRAVMVRPEKTRDIDWIVRTYSTARPGKK